jgi:hypothetical protein
VKGLYPLAAIVQNEAQATGNNVNPEESYELAALLAFSRA